MKQIGFAILATLVMVGGRSMAADDSQDAAMEALKSVQQVVGDWEGSGNSDASKGWDEKATCSWKFADDGAVSLFFTFADESEKPKAGRLMDEASLSYDAKKKQYKFLAQKTGEKQPIEFIGEAKSETNLVLDRVDSKGSDKLDRLDIKLLNSGDRLVYSFQRRIGRSKVYRPFAMVGLDRQGASLAASASSGPKCIVTGGAGTMTVSYMGKSYYVCCSGCRATFLDDPEKFIAKAEKK